MDKRSNKACVDLIIITPSVFFIQLNSLGTKKITFWWYADRKKILTIKKFILVSFGTRRFQRNFQLRWTNLVLPIDFLICLHQAFNLVKKFIFNSVMIDLTDLLELLQYRKLDYSCLPIPKSSRKLPTFSWITTQTRKMMLYSELWRRILIIHWMTRRLAR